MPDGPSRGGSMEQMGRPADQRGTEDFLSDLAKINGMDVLTSSSVLDNIQFYDYTVDIVGYVDGIEAPHYVGNKSQYKVFKFFLNNGDRKRIQVMAWNEDIELVEKYIKSNYIINLEGVQARPPKAEKYNKGNVPYELLICSETKVATLGKYKLESSLDVEPERIEFSDVLNTSTRVINPPYFEISSLNDLSKINGRMSLSEILKIPNRTPTKRTSANNLSQQHRNKKSKLE